MAKRKTAAKRALIRKKRMMRRNRSRMPRSLRQPVQYFKRSTYSSGFISNSTTQDIHNNYFFTLNSIPGVSDFTGLYDQYRINAVKWTLIPRGNNSDITPGSGSTSSANSVGIFSCLDYDDSTNLTSITQYLQYQNNKMTRTHQQHSRYLKPKINAQIVNNVTSVSAVNMKGWLDITASDVPHYGIKYCLQQAPSSVQQFDLKVDYYIAFKCVR